MMQEQEKLQEIEELGAEELFREEAEEGEGEAAGSRGKQSSWVPLLQALICLAILVLLLVWKYTASPQYQEFRTWYGKEMSQEIEIPEIGLLQPKTPQESVPSPTPAPSVSQGVAQLPETPVQKLSCYLLL